MKKCLKRIVGLIINVYRVLDLVLKQFNKIKV